MSVATQTPSWNALSSWLMRAALRWGQQTFVVSLRDDTAQQLTYAQAAKAVEAAAAWLNARFGLRTGTSVVLLPQNSTEDLVALLAALRTGANVTIVSPVQSKTRRLAQIDRVSPALVLGREEVTDGVDAPCLVPGRLVEATPTGAPLPRDAGAGEIRLFTTGSTALAKIVRLTQRNFIVNGLALAQHHQLGPSETVFSANPIYFANALGFVCIATMLSGARSVLVQRFDPLRFMRQAQTFDATILNMVPATLEAALAAARGASPPSLRYVKTAAAPLPRGLAEAAFFHHKLRIVQGYGLTETTNFSLIMPTDLDDRGYIATMIDTDIPPVGRPVRGCQVTLSDTAELRMRGASVMRGYLGNPEATREAFEAGWFRSGDLARAVRLPGGAIGYALTGRIKNVVKRRGVAVSLEEVERLLGELPEFTSAAVVANDIGADTRLQAVVTTPTSGAGKAWLSDVNRVLAQSIGSHCQLDQLQVVDALPRFSNGKLDRHRLSELLERKVPA